MIGGLTNHLWQSTFFALAAGLLTLVLRRNRAKVRFWLWLSASLKFLIPFSVLMSVGSQLHWEPARQIATQIGTPTVSYAVEQISEPFSVTPVSGGVARKDVDWLPIVLLTAWMCGVGILAFVRLRDWLRIRAAVGASTPIGIPAAVEVRSSPGLVEPGVVGLVRPILLLPQGIPERLTASQLEAVLAHELCHVRRRDNLFASFHMAVEIVFWFHPLVWWIGARMVEERERACDEEVLSLGNQPRTYADAILNVCKLYTESRLACVAGVSGANIRRRIEAIMTNRTGLGLNRAKKLLLAGAGVMAVAGPVAIGVLIGMGHVPLILAQSPITQLTAPTRPVAQEVAQLVQGRGPAQFVPRDQPVITPQGVFSQDRRLVVLFFDLDAMTPDQQSNARQASSDFVQNGMKPTDMVSIMAARNGAVIVAQDFTDNSVTLKSAILNLDGGSAGSAPDAAKGLSNIITTVNMLAGFPAKKALMYYSPVIAGGAAVDDQAELRKNAITAATRANVAIYPMDVRRTFLPMAQLALTSPGGRSMTPPTPQSGVLQDETDRRIAAAQEKFGSTRSAMARTYIRYGPPDQIEGVQNGQSSTQVWRYNYLEDFHSNAELEFVPANGGLQMKINWPLPQATFTGVGDVNVTLVGALDKELQGKGAPVSGAPIAGLPGRHASFQIFPGGYRVLAVPLDSLSGSVDIAAQIRTRTDNGVAGQMVAGLRDGTQASTGGYQVNFSLPAGSYVCSVVVREGVSGRTFGESINFEVK